MRVSTILLVFFSVTLYSQTIINYTINEGLHFDNYVECIDVDPNANEVVWIGTPNAVQIFNGIEWDTLNSYTNIKVIKHMINGDVWIGNDYGLYYFNGQSWTTFNINSGLISNQIKSIDEAPNGWVWVGTNLGVSYYDGINFSSYSSPDLHWSGVNSTAFDSNGDIWFSSPLGGVTKFDGVNFIQYDTSQGLLSQNITDLEIDIYDNKWIGSSSGITVLSSDNLQYTHHTRMFIMPPPDTLNPVVDIEIDSKGRIWAAIYVGYLSIGAIAYWDGLEWESLDISDGLVGENIKDIDIDNEDNIWISTTTGVSKILDFTTNFDFNENTKQVIYPNPNNGNFHVNLEKDVIDLQVFDILGNLVLRRSVNNSKKLILEYLDKSIYILEITLNNNEKIIQRLIVN
tara:strand:+ start:31737 stop:32936 length:1200 start_codon:yes stop_codon:yes gene_type:complete